MNHSYMVCMAVSLTAAATAHASVDPIAEFAGEVSETFENIAAPGGVPGPATIFNGAGTINDMLANTLVIATSVSSADTKWETFLPYDGFLMGLMPTGWTTFTFDPPITQFGGYIGSAAFQDGGGVTFLDANDSTIASITLDVPSLEWMWYGWQSETPIATIQIRGSANPGSPLVFDNLQIGYDAAGIEGDLNGDGVVDVSDLLLLLAEWGACDDCEADLNGDGTVDVSDLLVLLANWG